MECQEFEGSAQLPLWDDIERHAQHETSNGKVKYVKDEVLLRKS